MIIPLANLQQQPSNFRRQNHGTSSCVTKMIVTYKRSLLLTIAALGIFHYSRSSQYTNTTKDSQFQNHANTQKSDTSSSSSYLYPPHEAHPFVLDYNPSDNNSDFRQSNSPKVIEFYDPKCGACQAFKYNYIEVAKKIMEERPNVKFYGVSCEVYKSMCKDEYGVTRFPKILVFPDGNGGITKDDGIEVPKGTGTIYFVAARLMKALRTKEEIERDRVESSKLTAGT